MQGRRLLTSLVRSLPSVKPPRYPPRRPLPRDMMRDAVGRPKERPIVFQTIKMMERLTPEEKKKFGYIFSQLLGLPEPPEETKTIVGDKFAVKLVKFEKDRERKVERAVACVVSDDVVLKSLDDLGPGSVLSIVQNVPSVVKQGVSKEEADEIIAKIEAAGGVAVMEPLME